MKLLLSLLAISIFTPGLISATEADTPTGMRYDLVVRVEPADRRIQAEARIQSPSSSRFYLHKDLSIERMEADGKSVAFRIGPPAPANTFTSGAVTVDVAAVNPRELQITYGGKIAEVLAGVNMVSTDLVELACYSAWFPRFDELKTYDFELEVDLPREFILTTNGRLVKERNDGDRMITNWVSYYPTFDMALVASPKLKRVARTVNDTLVEVYFHLYPAELARSEMEGFVAGLERFETLYGKPYGGGNARVVYSPRDGWGYSRTPLIVVSENSALGSLKQEGGKAKIFRYNAHELAHSWWSIANASTPNDWINEGLAEYTSFRLTRERFGAAFGEKQLAEYKSKVRQNKTTDRIAETEQASPDREINRYFKVALIMLEAEQRYGRENVDAFLMALHQRFVETRDATTSLFLEVAGQQLGEEAESFFREELYRQPATHHE